MVGPFAGVVSGCVGGDSVAAERQELIAQVEGVVTVDADASEPGLPRNWLYFASIQVEESLSDEELSHTVDGTVVAARDAWAATARGGVTLTYTLADAAADLRGLDPVLADALGVTDYDLGGARLSFTDDALEAYVSPYSDGAE